MLSRRTLVQTSLAAGLMAGLAGLSVFANWYVDNTGWREISWPFPRDAWPVGQAWRGEGGLEIYIRPKRGFCGNCDTGVVEDSEVDRVTDIDLLDEMDTSQGRLTFVRHAAVLSGTPTTWARPPVPLGTHAPVWPV